MSLHTHLFLIGPGSEGKSTVGPILAERLGLTLCDIDSEFLSRIGSIGTVIEQRSYEAYVAANHELFKQLLAEAVSPTLFVLSSGFLAHERAPDIAALNRQIVKRSGTSVLLLPDADPNVAVEIVLKRHITRTYITTPPERERERYLARLPIYLAFGPDLTVYSAKSPKQIAEQMHTQLAALPTWSRLAVPIERTSISSAR